MKINKSFRLSEEAVEVLNKQPNSTEFLENLILNKNTQPVPWMDLEYRIDMLSEKIDGLSSKGRTVDFDSTNLGSNPSEPAIRSDSRVPMTPDNPSQLTSLPICCLGKSPCKHWVWNGVEEAYFNSITGERREINA